MRSRRWPDSFYRRQDLVDELILAVPARDMPLDVWGGLTHAAFIVHLTPREFSEFALAVAWVRYHQSTRRHQVQA